jgi:tetratricopeptide (TPR) repeat protein
LRIAGGKWRAWIAAGFAAAIFAFFAICAQPIATAANAMPTARVSAADGAALVQTAQHQFNSGNYTAAITSLQAAISQNSSNAEAYYWLGRCYYEVRDFDSAVTQAEKSVSLDAKNSVYHQWLGTIYGGKADRDRSFFLAKKVKKEFEEAVRLNPSNVQARRDLEEFCIDAPFIVGGSKDEARGQIEAIAAIDPVEGHLARAVFDQNASKNLAGAESEYRQVLDAKPSRIEPYLEVAGFFQGQNKPSDIDAAIQAAAKVNAKDLRLSYFMGVSRVLSGTDSAKAEMYLKSYLASTPDRSDWPSHAAARDWLGRLYEAQGKRAEAAEQYRASLRLDPGRKETQARLEKLEKSSK